MQEIKTVFRGRRGFLVYERENIMNRTCNRCKRTLALNATNFCPKKGGGFYYWCRQCAVASNRRWYQRIKSNAYAPERSQKALKAFIQDYKDSQ